MARYEIIILFIDCFSHRDTVVNSLMKESEILSSTDAKLAVATPASVSPMLSPDEMPSRTEAMSITQDGSEATQSMTNSIDTHTPIDVSRKSFVIYIAGFGYRFGLQTKWLHMCHGNACNLFAPVVLLGPSGPWLR